MRYTTISSGVVLTSSRIRPGLLPDFSRFSLEKAGKTGRSAEQVCHQSATRSGRPLNNAQWHFFKRHSGTHCRLTIPGTDTSVMVPVLSETCSLILYVLYTDSPGILKKLTWLHEHIQTILRPLSEHSLSITLPLG
jgi:hypothetical protein